MLLKAGKIKKEYGIQQVLDIDKLEIWEGSRIGLVGPNGAGKSTLLHILFGDLEADEGTVDRRCEIAMIPQNGEAEGEADGELISHLNLKGNAVKSGGEKTRMAIAAAFSRHAPLLLADEPTTNLDVSGTLLLERMLLNYGSPHRSAQGNGGGAMVIISHDRQLLDNICNTIWELDDGKLKIFPGNYSAWFAQRKQEREFAVFEFEKYRSEKKRLEKIVVQVKDESKSMAKPPKRMGHSEWMLYKGIAKVQQGHMESRGKALESRLNHLEKKERPKELPAITMSLGEVYPMKAKVAARVKELSVAYGTHIVLDHVSLDIATGKKTFLTGANGSGKTTLVSHLINGGEGTFVTEDARIGYFSQEHELLDFGKTVLENVREDAVVPESVCRAVLANLYMKEQDINKKVSVLSGGERVKTAIARLLVNGCNLMILDEPTNHMDIYTMEALEALFCKWKGTMLIITHDRKLTENLADVVISLPR